MAIRLRTLSGQTTTLADDNLEELRMTFQSPLLAAAEAGHDDARVVQNR